MALKDFIFLTYKFEYSLFLIFSFDFDISYNSRFPVYFLRIRTGVASHIVVVYVLKMLSFFYHLNYYIHC